MESGFVSCSVAGASLIPGLLNRTSSRVGPEPQPSVMPLLMDVLFQDVHSRYRTEAHQDVVGRFNERYVCSTFLSTFPVGSLGGRSIFILD